MPRVHPTWPPPIKTKIMNEKGKSRMKISMVGVHHRAFLRPMSWIGQECPNIKVNFLAPDVALLNLYLINALEF